MLRLCPAPPFCRMNLFRAFFLSLLLFSSVLKAEEQGAAQFSSEERGEILRKFSEISRKANEDPEIAELREKMQAAQNAYRKAIEAAVAKEDPQLLEQYNQLREAMRAGPGGHEGSPVSRSIRRREGEPGGYDALSDEERQQLDAARQQAMQSPVVIEARQRRNTANTEEERRTSAEEYRQTLHQAMIEADEKVEELLKKLGAGSRGSEQRSRESE